jgi:hypothetical protein
VRGDRSASAAPGNIGACHGWGFDASLGPKDLTTEGALEVLNCGHRYGVDHLLVELGIVFRRRQSVGCKKVGIVQIHGLVVTSAGGINIDDLEIVTCWTWQQTGLSLQLAVLLLVPLTLPRNAGHEESCR